MRKFFLVKWYPAGLHESVVMLSKTMTVSTYASPVNIKQTLRQY